MDTEYKVTKVEAGYYRVGKLSQHSRVMGHLVGHVFLDKMAGSLRSGSWVARSSDKTFVSGINPTKDAAVAALVAWHKGR